MSKISVIIPVYNAEKYLEQTIACLQKQTFHDFDVYLINDGSLDFSEKICEKISNIDKRFIYINQGKQGVSATRNRGLDLCYGEFVTFIDADDLIPENYLEELMKIIEKNDAQIAICDVVTVNKGREETRFSCPKNILNQREALNFLLSRQNINSGPCGKLFRRETIEKLRFPGLRVYEDILFVSEAFSKCYRISATSETKYLYVQNDDSVMHKIKEIPLNDVVVATEKIIAMLKKRKDLEPSCFYITLSHLMQYVIPILDNNNKDAIEFVSSVKKVYRRNLLHIWKCVAFPWKEKILYTLFAFGWFYNNKKEAGIDE